MPNITWHAKGNVLMADRQNIGCNFWERLKNLTKLLAELLCHILFLLKCNCLETGLEIHEQSLSTLTTVLLRSFVFHPGKQKHQKYSTNYQSVDSAN